MLQGVNKRQTTKASAGYAFVFLEIFECEGGIQSYVKDVLKAYLTLEPCPSSDVFILRDGPGCPNPFEGHRGLRFHYGKSRWVNLGRMRLAIHLLVYLLFRRPQRVFCGHVMLAPLVRFLCRPLGIPYTVMTYGKEFWEPLPDKTRQALKQAASIWTISRYSRDRACKTNNLEASSIQLLPCIVNGEMFTLGPKSPELIEQYDLRNARVLMTVARLWPGDRYKGVDVTIQALPSIRRVFPNVKYLVIGRGGDQPRLAQLAADLGVSDQVIFAGFVPTEHLVEHYRLADAYVMPSQEGFGIVYLEAMACGVPVLSGDADGSADPLQDSRLGWRVSRRDSAAVAAACIDMLRGDDQRCDSTWLRQQVLAAFSPQALADKLKRLLNSRLEKSQ
ncbi:MAG: glycosyltransferase family 4 protein [Cyanothece sp. SIO1E1]|nr:glycosyltransferase family 4 protein [Cyanothece sp. SIO1E1]